MKLFNALAPAFALLLCALPACAQDAAPNAATSANVLPFETLALGETSGCKRPAKLFIGGEAEWRRVWRMARGAQSPAPAVDWQRQRVVALLGGTQGEGASVQLLRAIREGDALTLYVWRDEGAPLVAAHKGAMPMGATQPFHFALVPFASSNNVKVRFAPASELACPACATGLTESDENTPPAASKR